MDRHQAADAAAQHALLAQRHEHRGGLGQRPCRLDVDNGVAPLQGGANRFAPDEGQAFGGGGELGIEGGELQLLEEHRDERQVHQGDRSHHPQVAWAQVAAGDDQPVEIGGGVAPPEEIEEVAAAIPTIDERQDAPLGSLGEGATLTYEEKLEILRTCVDAAGGDAQAHEYDGSSFLPVLLGEKPDAAEDESMKDRVEKAALVLARQEKIAAAGGKPQVVCTLPGDWMGGASTTSPM